MTQTTHQANDKNSPKIGDICCTIFGYEARIARFYQIIEVKPASIVIKRIDEVNTYENAMQWTSVPVPNVAHPRFMERKLVRFKRKENYYFSEIDRQGLFKWDGNPVECYNYH